MKKITKIIIGIIVLIIIVLLVSFNVKAPKAGELSIGTIIPLSGNMAFIGEDFKKGLDLALVNNPEIVINYEDNKGDVTALISAYQKLQTTVKPDVIISAGIGDLAIIPLAEKDNTPLMLTVSSASNLPAMGKNIFRYFTNADSDAPVMAQYTVNKLGLKKVAVLYLQDQFGFDYKNVFTKEITKLGGQIVAEESFQYTDFDYRTQISKIKNSGFDTIYLVGLDYQLVTVIKQIRELGIDKQIISIGTIATRDSIDKAGASIEGVYVTAFCVDGMPEKYVSEFQAKYNSYPGFFSELGYDIGKMIISASKGGNERDDIRAGLLAIKNFQTNTGLVSADKNGEMVMPVCVKQITSGKIYNTVTGNYSDF
jgi:branched-chain amino acid transport system substrate-binding protein